MTETRFIKRALKREPGYPAGVPAPLYIDCLCGNKLSPPARDDGFYCDTCGREYTPHGWLEEEPK